MLHEHSRPNATFARILGALLHPHVHFRCVVVEGVFEADSAGGVRFHEARGIGPETIAEIQAQVRHRLMLSAVRSKKRSMILTKKFSARNDRRKRLLPLRRAPPGVGGMRKRQVRRGRMKGEGG